MLFIRNASSTEQSGRKLHVIAEGDCVKFLTVLHHLASMAIKMATSGARFVMKTLVILYLPTTPMAMDGYQKPLRAGANIPSAVCGISLVVDWDRLTDIAIELNTITRHVQTSRVLSVRRKK